jgi:hypothetical protein
VSDNYIGGEGGIRTPDRLAPMPHFECGAFDHSATSPGAKTGRVPALPSGRVLGEDGGPDKARVGRIPRAGCAILRTFAGHSRAPFAFDLWQIIYKRMAFEKL